MRFPEFPASPVQLCCWGYAEGKEGARVPFHEHDYWQANFTLSGKCLMRTSEGNFLLHDDDLIFIAPGVRHSLSYQENYLSYSCKFHVEGTGLPRVLHAEGSPFTKGVIEAAKVILETTFPPRFFGVQEGTIILPQDHYQTLMEHFLAGVLETFRREQREHSGILNRFYREQEKLGRPFFSVEEAADACGYSRNHFSLLIRQQTGMSAKDFLNGLRLKNAEQFLRYSDESISRISGILGFSSQFHFSSFFKRMTGITPLRYRKEKSGKYE